MTKTSEAEEHIEDNVTFMVAEPVRSTGFDGDKFGESREAVHSELLTQLVAADDILGSGGPREARLQGRDDDEKVGEIDRKKTRDEKRTPF